MEKPSTFLENLRLVFLILRDGVRGYRAFDRAWRDFDRSPTGQAFRERERQRAELAARERLRRLRRH